MTPQQFAKLCAIARFAAKDLKGQAKRQRRNQIVAQTIREVERRLSLPPDNTNA